jgi:hypothetical protein
MEKTPLYWGSVEQIHEHASRFSAQEPVLAPLRPAYVLMWRPLCLAFLSSHFLEKVKHAIDEKELNAGSTVAFSKVIEAATGDVQQAERAIELHKWARKVGAPLVVACDTISINFARRMYIIDCITCFEYSKKTGTESLCFLLLSLLLRNMVAAANV